MLVSTTYPYGVWADPVSVVLTEEGDRGSTLTLGRLPSHSALGWNSPTGCGRSDRSPHQVSETNAEAESTSCVFRRAQEVGWTLD